MGLKGEKMELVDLLIEKTKQGKVVWFANGSDFEAYIDNNKLIVGDRYFYVNGTNIGIYDNLYREAQLSWLKPVFDAIEKGLESL